MSKRIKSIDKCIRDIIKLLNGRDASDVLTILHICITDVCLTCGIDPVDEFENMAEGHRTLKLIDELQKMKAESSGDNEQ